MAFRCCYCSSFAGNTFKKLLSHIKFIHSHEPNFTIACGDCGQSFQKFNSFKSHIQRKHNTNIIAERQENDVDVEDNDNLDANSIDEEDHAEGVGEEEEPRNFVDEMTRYLALFVLKNKEENQLSQRGIDEILDSTGELVESSLDHLKEEVTTCLERNGLAVADIEGLSDVLQQPCIFAQARQPLVNEYQQLQYFKNNFDLVVSLVRTFCNLT